MKLKLIGSAFPGRRQRGLMAAGLFAGAGWVCRVQIGLWARKLVTATSQLTTVFAFLQAAAASVFLSVIIPSRTPGGPWGWVGVACMAMFVACSLSESLEMRAELSINPQQE